MLFRNSKNKTSLSWIFINSLAIFFAVLLIFSKVATFVNPEKFVWFAYFGLGFPFLLGINILLAVFLIFNLKKTAILSLFAIGLNWSNIQAMAQFNSAEFDINEKKIRVLSYNVNLFDHHGNISSQKGQTQQDILNFLKQETPDIVCFQEFRESLKEPSITRFLTQHVDLKYSSISRRGNTVAFGNKIYSKFPILRDSLIRFENSNNMIVFADVLAYGDTIRVFNFHLESIGFHKDDDLFYQELVSTPTEVSELKKGVGNLLKKMNVAYAKRAEQAKILAQLIADSPYQTIACGDMNDIPVSYSYRQIFKNMNDSFRKRGFGLGTSYGGVYPSFRIDYIFFSEGFNCENFTTVRVKYSDHFPISSDLKITNL
ncbi:MAG: endonuclease/exonuclease/phosphatase family protein [Bacteroidales bacterium]|jgi:endonuclease/exonuclease/phosphatase family metal-dependent hydrolase|nr:endonuclease/exonuclease/phosphatase family protein [Bacteroidales bacterium]